MTRRCCLYFLFCALLGWAPGDARGAEAPYFTWGAFQRFWNKMCTPGLEMEQFSTTVTGYSVNYGRGVVINVRMRGDQVESLTLLFDSREELGGGPLFLRGVHTAVRVGTYGWPQDRVALAQEEFAAISASQRIYEWGGTRFTRTGYDNGMWEFVMTYLLP